MCIVFLPNWIWQKYNTHMTVKDHIYAYTLTNIDNELYCYSNEFHSHLPFNRPWHDKLEKENKLLLLGPMYFDVMFRKLWTAEPL
jgi:hypothetical protein